MRIGVKYCGGCNPVYDRVANVNKLTKECEPFGIELVAYRKNQEYDACLLVKGCTRNCLAEEFPNCKKLYVVAAEGDFEPLPKVWQEAICQEKGEQT
ncbi:MAG: hypothetical protein ACK5MN_03095 [Lachnospiraceae bacterium]